MPALRARLCRKRRRREARFSFQRDVFCRFIWDGGLMSLADIHQRRMRYAGRVTDRWPKNGVGKNVDVSISIRSALDNTAENEA